MEATIAIVCLACVVLGAVWFLARSTAQSRARQCERDEAIERMRLDREGRADTAKLEKRVAELESGSQELAARVHGIEKRNVLDAPRGKGMVGRLGGG